MLWHSLRGVYLLKLCLLTHLHHLPWPLQLQWETKLQIEAILQEILGKLAFYYVAFVMPHMQTPPFGWSYVVELLHTFYTC